ncbi:MAG: type II toxin-antitoxin system PemK/MazF family toxin [Planctomycetaceae bacterium]
MNVSRGDVVLVDFPFSDRTGSKVRPCLVVQSDHNNRRLDDTIVVTITSRTHHVATEPTQLLIDVATPAGQQSGLLFTSAVQCENVLTVDGHFVLRRIGVLPADVMQQVNECLKAALEIP